MDRKTLFALLKLLGPEPKNGKYFFNKDYQAGYAAGSQEKRIRPGMTMYLRGYLRGLLWQYPGDDGRYVTDED